jgi:hypothetical protein
MTIMIIIVNIVIITQNGLRYSSRALQEISKVNGDASPTLLLNGITNMMAMMSK